MTERTWSILIEVVDTQAVLKISAGEGDPPTVQEALAALEFGKESVNNIRLTTTPPEEPNGND